MKKALTLPHRVGLAMRRRREALKMNQDDFADSISMHRTQYSALERGEKNLSLASLNRVSEGLGIKISELLDDAGL